MTTIKHKPLLHALRFLQDSSPEEEAEPIPCTVATCKLQLTAVDTMTNLPSVPMSGASFEGLPGIASLLALAGELPGSAFDSGGGQEVGDSTVEASREVEYTLHPLIAAEPAPNALPSSSAMLRSEDAIGTALAYLLLKMMKG